MDRYLDSNLRMQEIMNDMHREKERQEKRQNLHENPVLAIRPIIENQIRNFENSLDNQYFVGAWLASFGSQRLILVEQIQLEEPCLIIFHGKDEHGSPLSLIQHVSQLNFLLQAYKLDTDTPRTPIGFIHS